MPTSQKKPEHPPSERPSWVVSVLLALACVAGPFLAAPVVLHSANVLDFNVDLQRGLTGPLALAILAFLFLVLTLRLPGRGAARRAAVVLAVAWLFWLQGQLLVWDYGVLDGRAIDWWGQWWRGAVDTALWIGLLAAAVVGADRLRSQLGTLSLALLAIYAVTVANAIITREPAPAFHRFAMDDTHRFDFSADRNVMLIVLDAFQADVFQELLDTRPDLFGAYEGFTFYRNASAGFAKTYASIPLMLTGRWYDNAMPVTEFVVDAFLEDSVPAELVAADWRVDLFPDIPRVVHHDDRVASNVVVRDDPLLVAIESGRLADLSLFRVSPHFLKRLWLNDGQGRIAPAWRARVLADGDDSDRREVDHPNPAARFGLSAEAYGRVFWEQPAFKFYHLMVPHEPFLLREDFSVERWPAGREGYVGQSAATVRVVERLLLQLQELDIYDDATLLIVADHGGGDYNAGVRTGDVVPPPEAGTEPSMSAQYHASALPLVLLKPAGAQGPLAVSDTPVSIGDVAATLAEAAGAAPRTGTAIGGSDRDPGEERRYYFYRHQGWNGTYLPPMEEFRVLGHSWDVANWASTGRIIAPGGEVRRVEGLAAGRRAAFDGLGLTSAWLSEGWSGAEAVGTWSAARSAALRIPLALAADEPPPTHLHAWVDPYLAEGNIEVQRVNLSLEQPGQSLPLGSWRVDASACHSVALPGNALVDSDVLALRWALPDAAAPNAFGLSPDFRLLGVRLKFLELGGPRSAPLDTPITALPPDTLDCAVQRTGWGHEGDAFVSSKPLARLRIRLDDARQDRGVTVSGVLIPFLGDGQINAQRVTLRMGETVLWQTSIERTTPFTVSLPPDQLEGDVLDLWFDLPDAATPASLGINSDQRALAVRMRELKISLTE